MNKTNPRITSHVIQLDMSDLSQDNGGLHSMLWGFTAIMCFSILLNSAIIMACFLRNFDKPLLLFITLCSLTDTAWAIVGVSYYLATVLAAKRNISFVQCLVEMFVLYFTSIQQFLNIWLMYIDRHLAIFWPYTYVARIANKRGALKLVAVVWTLGLILSISHPAVTTLMIFCKPVVVIQDVTCVFGAVARSACGNYKIPIIVTAFISYSMGGLTGITAMYSTWKIIRKCRKSTTEVNQKALHTCLTQLFVTLTNFLSMVFISVFKRFVHHPMASVTLDLTGIVIPATIDPLIFGLRIQEIRTTFSNLYHRLEEKLFHKGFSSRNRELTKGNITTIL